MDRSAGNANDNRSDNIHPVKRFLQISEVCEIVGLSRSMVYKCMKDPDIAFPMPIKIGALSRWRQEDINRWADLIRAQ